MTASPRRAHSTYTRSIGKPETDWNQFAIDDKLATTRTGRARPPVPSSEVPGPLPVRPGGRIAAAADAVAASNRFAINSAEIMIVSLQLTLLVTAPALSLHAYTKLHGCRREPFIRPTLKTS